MPKENAFLSQQAFPYKVFFSNLMEFNETIEALALVEPKWDRDSFTWSNKEFGRRRIACRLDRILVNQEIVTLFSEARVITGTNGLSDHATVIIQLNHSVQHSHKP